MFEKELEYIKSERIKNIVKYGIEIIPAYFYHVPASSSGKYHPKFALGEGGLYRHVKATVIVANQLFGMNDYKFFQFERDLIIGSLILHDGWKQGLDKNGHTLFLHPTIAAQELWNNNNNNNNIVDKILLGIICLNIMSHMGQWNTDKYSNDKLMKPITRMQKFVHLCDYLASRRSIEVVIEN